MFANKIDIRHLRYFVAIVRNGSFRGASAELNISQPPLSRQIQQLEDYVGVSLLTRRSSGIEPTSAGKAFFVEACNIIDLLERACERTQLIGTGRLGKLDVGVFGSAVLDFVPRFVLGFRNSFPDVEVVLHNMDREAQVKALRERRILLGFNRFFLDYPDLVWESVIRERMIVAVPSEHPLARKSAVSLRDLADEPLIFYPRTDQPGGFSNYLQRLFSNLNIEPKIVQNVDDVVTAIAFVSSGLGLTLGVESARNLQLPGVHYLSLDEREVPSFDLSLIYRADEDSPLLKLFIESVKQSMAAQNA
ncbi:LysR family transcriptional regulator [Novosphingobium naphthalenivorans]|uniref:LysR family transcriptional regulator n=1 Tax=Novosphingobium naphthalenivorans TaxID=273168 RepID=UPI00082ABA98|nr:LysR family transcriptional regulator [Novosphingobium naphthalenivorans]